MISTIKQKNWHNISFDAIGVDMNNQHKTTYITVLYGK